MKTTKKFIAIVLAALMLALMVPFAVSAADETYTLNLTSSKEGLKFEIIQIATLDIQTGKYTNAYNTDIETAINNGNSQAALKACDKIDWAKETYNSKTYSADEGAKGIENLSAGVYYIRNTEKPATVTDVTNRIIVLPCYENGKWNSIDEVIDLAAKLQIDPVVTKKIVNSKEDNDIYTTAAIGEDVEFELRATVAGTTSDKLSYYAITDQMDLSLTMKEKTINVSLVKGSDTKKLTTAEYTYVPADGGFKIELSEDYLKGDEFYSYSDVVVTYSATLNEGAKVGAEGNLNSDALDYKHIADPEVNHHVDGNTVYVFSLKINVTKVDAADGKTIADKKAKFALLDANKKVIAEDYTTNGVLSFVGIDQGTYYVQETEAPDGYALNTSLFEIVLDPEFVTATDGTVTMTLDKTKNVDTYELTVEDSKTVLPTTGSVGNMIFTIIGAAFVIAAGVVLVVAMKKRAK